jgi:hypothetical protein
MTRINNNKTQSFVSAPIATASIAVAHACCACDVSGQQAFGKSIGSMPNIDTLIDA